MSTKIDKNFKNLLLEIKEYIIIDESGNYIINEKDDNNNEEEEKENLKVHIINDIIIEIIEMINSENFFKLFPNINFTEILPDLPMTEEGYPNIDYTKYLIEKDDLQKFDENDNSEIIALNIINDDSYLNIIKVFYVLSKLEMTSNNELCELIIAIKDYIFVDKNGMYKINVRSNNYFYKKFNNLNTKELYELIKNYNNIDVKKTFSSNSYSIDFKTKNATMIVEINNQKLSFNKITFSLGGQYSSTFPKVGYNLKIRGNKELFGRRQFKLRADASEPSYMRTKLMCDIHNRLGIPSLSANYAILYINNEYMGLYILTDAFKESWIEYVYGEKDTTQLYKCEDCELSFETRQGFKNENNEITDNTELYKFLATITKAKSASDIESIFDLDQFYKEIAIEILSYGWDHLNNGHNYYLYKNYQNNKWIYFIHDFDFDLGVQLGGISPERNNLITYDLKDMKYTKNINKIILSDSQKFNETLKEIVIKVFNPATLFPRIDELKTYIEPYVKLDKTKNENGKYPGVLKKDLRLFFSFKDWEDSSEYGIIRSEYYGLKQFILSKYRYICKSYEIDCDPKYLDENMELPTNQTEISTNEKPTQVISTSTTQSTEISSDPSTTIQTLINSDSTLSPTPTSSPIQTETTTSTQITTPTPSSFPESSITINCFSEIIGYSCCPPNVTIIYATDEYGDWGYDFSKKEWCGLTKYNVSSNENSEECWSEELGYPCCKGCKIYETDSDGSWGYESNHWCGIIPSQCQK
eukprot:jgi/Orpsp1_1/1177608/evm.model.c7180000062124.1